MAPPIYRPNRAGPESGRALWGTRLENYSRLVCLRRRGQEYSRGRLGIHGATRALEENCRSEGRLACRDGLAPRDRCEIDREGGKNRSTLGLRSPSAISFLEQQIHFRDNNKYQSHHLGVLEKAQVRRRQVSETSNDTLTLRTTRVCTETEQLLDLFEEHFQAVLAPDSKSARLINDDPCEQS